MSLSDSRTIGVTVHHVDIFVLREVPLRGIRGFYDNGLKDYRRIDQGKADEGQEPKARWRRSPPTVTP